MHTEERSEGSTPGAAVYTKPSLIIHGTVQELTAGGDGPDPDGSAVGSALIDG
jgi:hypothetical protein